jgi:predicted transcriptional regulator
MTVTISLPPEVQIRLQQRAAATGKDVSTLILEAVEATVISADPVDSAAQNRPYDQWLTEFNSWMNAVASRSNAYPPDFKLDDSRESIYEGRGE